LGVQESSLDSSALLDYQIENLTRGLERIGHFLRTGEPPRRDMSTL
jgi:hypothetical protein